MNNISDKEIFLEMIKDSIIKNCNNERILPSVFTSIAIKSSNWGNFVDVGYSKNLFNLTANTKDWYGKCYNVNNNKIYNSKSECKDKGAILIRAYNNYSESILDYISFVINYRRGNNGPLKYSSIKNCTDYKDCINRLIRCGFMQDQFYKINDIVEIQELIKIIEEYKLYNWDKEVIDIIKEENVMSKNRQRMIVRSENQSTNQNNIVEETQENITESIEEVEAIDTEDIQEIYRVRLSWDNDESQIFASPDSDLAIEEAKSHTGYKVFVGDDGELFNNPWEVVETTEEVSESNGVKDLIIPVAGRKIILKKEPVYDSPNSTSPIKYATGVFYFYDYGTYGKNGSRAKITENSNIVNDKRRNPKMIYGYINIG